MSNVIKFPKEYRKQPRPEGWAGYAQDSLHRAEKSMEYALLYFKLFLKGDCKSATTLKAMQASFKDAMRHVQDFKRWLDISEKDALIEAENKRIAEANIIAANSDYLAAIGHFVSDYETDLEKCARLAKIDFSEIIRTYGEDDGRQG